MTEEIKKRIIADIDEITVLVGQYDAATNDILTTDIDTTLAEILNRREEIIELVGEKRGDIKEAGAQCSESEQEMLSRIMDNGHIPLGIGRELREIHKAALKMRSAYIPLREKEQKANARVDARLKELRSELENLKDDKKRLDFYSNNKLASGKGGSFDSSL